MDTRGAPQAVRQTEHEAIVLQGSFSDFTLEQVLHVIGLSRQCLRLLVQRADVRVAELVIKSARVLWASAAHDHDPARVLAVLAHKTTAESALTFAIHHVQLTGPLPAPLIDLDEAWRRAQATDASAAASSPTATGLTAPHPARASAREERREEPHTPPRAAPNTEDMELHLRLERIEGLLRDLQRRVNEPDAALDARLSDTAEALARKAEALHAVDGKLQMLAPLVTAEIKALLHEHHANLRGEQPPPTPPAVIYTILALQIVALLVLLASLWTTLR